MSKISNFDLFYHRNGFSNAGANNESTGYGGLNHAHLQQPQSEATQVHPQPSPRPVNQQTTQENQQQANGGNLSNQQQNKPTSSVQQQAPTTEGQRPEGSQFISIEKLDFL